MLSVGNKVYRFSRLISEEQVSECYRVFRGPRADFFRATQRQHRQRGTPTACRLGTLPAIRLPEFIVAVEHLVEAASTTVEERRHLVTATVDAFARLPNPVPEDWFLDWGSNSPPEPSQRC